MKRVRVFGISIFDLLLGLGGMIIVFVIAWKVHFSKLSVWPFILAAILLTIPLGIIFHVIFGVNTKVNYVLKLSNAPKISS